MGSRRGFRGGSRREMLSSTMDVYLISHQEFNAAKSATHACTFLTTHHPYHAPVPCQHPLTCNPPYIPSCTSHPVPSATQSSLHPVPSAMFPASQLTIPPSTNVLVNVSDVQIMPAYENAQDASEHRVPQGRQLRRASAWWFRLSTVLG